ncbi:MAG: putative membrane-bound dehydrogenase-like protein [Verrucomicrobiales bacterium]|jgi:putative membrane-bound dehydrogenase-like protein
MNTNKHESGPTHFVVVLVNLAFALTASAQREQKTSDAPFLKPAEAVAKMDIPDPFEVSVFAAEPDIGEPIAFTFDSRGRVWVVENYNYVNRRSHTGEEVTRIQILEDTNSDGVFDSKKTFTDKLTFSSGIAVGFGGVFVGSPPHLTFIPDADGDDKPDGPPQQLLDGWGINDRHETLNSFIWGPDGWLYGCHGVFTQSFVGKPGAPDKDRLFIDGGIWRYHPTKNEFEIFARGLSNPWGFDFNDEGQGFATCCVIPHLFHIVQGGVYHKQSKPHLNPYVYDYIPTIRDHTHRSAHGGARFYLADVFPAKYRNQLFMCNIHQHQVLTDFMTPKGSSYVGSHGEDFISTNDLAWVGFSVQMGPEGGVYILDWHDTDICGNAINFPDSGRIYRIMPKGAKPIERPDVAALTDAELIAMQNHPNDWYVRRARLHLQMRATSGELDQKAAAAGLEEYLANAPTLTKRLRALWALKVTGNLDEERLLNLCGDSYEYVRAFAIQFLCEDGPPSASAQARFAEMAIDDDSAVVRLYLAAALQRMPFDQRWPILTNLAKHAEDIEDNNIPRMLWFALEPMVPANPDKSLEVAVNGRIPKLQEHVARRLVSGDLAVQQAKKGPKYKRGDAPAAAQAILQKVAPGFRIRDVGEGGVRDLTSFRNEVAVQTHPHDRNIPATIYRHLDVPKDGKTTLKIRASYHPHGDWQLRVQAGTEIIADKIVDYKNVKEEWLELEVDLTPFAGEHVDLKIENKANNWANEFGYWGSIRVVTE